MNKHVVLSFRLGTHVAINSIIGIPTPRQWGGSLNFATNEYSACLLYTKFALHYALIKQGLQPNPNPNPNLRPYLITGYGMRL